jgi:hypothetical protein
MTHEIPPAPRDYVPPPKPMSDARRAVVLRVAAVIAALYVVVAILWLMNTGETFARATLTLVPLGAIFAMVIVGLGRGMDTLTRWLGYFSTAVAVAALVLAFAAGK